MLREFIYFYRKQCYLNRATAGIFFVRFKLADDLIFLKTIDADMIGIGPFLPSPNTPLADAPPGSLEMTLKVVAVARLLLPHALLPATTAVGTLAPGGTAQALQAGANVLMPNITPPQYRALYSIYPNRSPLTEAALDPDHGVEELVRSIGRTVGTGYGHSGRRSRGLGSRV